MRGALGYANLLVDLLADPNAAEGRVVLSGIKEHRYFYDWMVLLQKDLYRSEREEYRQSLKSIAETP